MSDSKDRSLLLSILPPTVLPPTVLPPTILPPTILPPTVLPPTLLPPTTCVGLLGTVNIITCAALGVTLGTGCHFNPTGGLGGLLGSCTPRKSSSAGAYISVICADFSPLDHPYNGARMAISEVPLMAATLPAVKVPAPALRQVHWRCSCCMQSSHLVLPRGI